MVSKNAGSAATAPDTSTDASTELTLPDGKTVVVRQANPAEVQRFMSGGMLQETEETSEQIATRMVEQIFSAQSFGEALDMGQVTHVRDYLDEPIVIRSVDWQKSKYNGDDSDSVALPLFAVIHAVDKNGQGVTLTTGAFMPCAMMYAAQQRGDLDSVIVKFVKRDRPTKKGYYPLNLVRA